jgi:hypothetical protein
VLCIQTGRKFRLSEKLLQKKEIVSFVVLCKESCVFSVIEMFTSDKLYSKKLDCKKVWFVLTVYEKIKTQIFRNPSSLWCIKCEHSPSQTLTFYLL